jgi:hypothetical protein
MLVVKKIAKVLYLSVRIKREAFTIRVVIMLGMLFLIVLV